MERGPCRRGMSLAVMTRNRDALTGPNSPHAWDRYWKQTPEGKAPWRNIDMRLMQFVTIQPSPAWIVDFGAGKGRHTLPLFRQGYNVVAIDHSPVAVQYLATFGVYASEADLDRLRPSNSEARLRPSERGFDVALLIEVLEHLRDPEAAVRRLSTCVRPGGLIVATSPDDCLGDDPTHRHVWTRDEFTALVTSGSRTGIVLASETVDHGYTGGRGRASLVVVRR